MDLSLLCDFLYKYNIDVSSSQLERFRLFYELLIEKNKVMNLTAITEPSEVVTKHFIDSLALISVIPDLESMDYRIIDVGTGAGFPGIPLKIVFPNLKITLFDSLNKRIVFLNEVIESLGLSGIEGVHGRAEEFGKNKDYRGLYDICVSRAVANLSTLSEYCLPFVKPGGSFISYKSDTVDEEIRAAEKAISILGGRVFRIEKYELFGTDAMRSLVIINKEKDTPKKYPRKAPLPSKNPL